MVAFLSILILPDSVSVLSILVFYFPIFISNGHMWERKITVNMQTLFVGVIFSDR